MLRMNFKWKRITVSDVERLARVCNLTPIERKLLELRRKETTPEVIACEIGYGKTQMHYYSNKLLDKIIKEL